MLYQPERAASDLWRILLASLFSRRREMSETRKTIPSLRKKPSWGGIKKNRTSRAHHVLRAVESPSSRVDIPWRCGQLCIWLGEDNWMAHTHTHTRASSRFYDATRKYLLWEKTSRNGFGEPRSRRLIGQRRNVGQFNMYIQGVHFVVCVKLYTFKIGVFWLFMNFIGRFFDNLYQQKAIQVEPILHTLDSISNLNPLTQIIPNYTNDSRSPNSAK